jgi:hypothetical protein
LRRGAGEIEDVESRLYGIEAVGVRAVEFDVGFEPPGLALYLAEILGDRFFVCGGWCSSSRREAQSARRIVSCDHRKQTGHRDA